MANKVIWKETLSPGVWSQEIMLPTGAEILKVADQFGKIVLWFCCDPTETQKKLRRIVVVMTGEHHPLTGRYLGTVFLDHGWLVCHIFEEKEINND